MKRAFWLACAGLVLIGIGCAAWGFWFEPRRLVVREVTLRPDGWPAVLAGLRIAVLADLHVGAPHMDLDRLRDIVARTNGLKPDLTLLGGDYTIDGIVGGRFVPPEQIVPLLSELRASLGVYAVLGNHDRWHGKLPRSEAAFVDQPIRLLEDDAVRITRGDAAFWLVGLRDAFTTTPDVIGTLRKLTDASPALALTHSPDVFPEIPERVALTIAAHTHCGQVALPIVGRPIVPSRYGQRYACGLVREGKKQIYVVPGIGTSIIPVRFNAPPEITVLRLDAGG